MAYCMDMGAFFEVFSFLSVAGARFAEMTSILAGVDSPMLLPLLSDLRLVNAAVFG